MSTTSAVFSQPDDGFSWSDFAMALRRRVEPAHFETWLAQCLCGGHECGVLVLWAPSPFVQEWIHRHYLEQLREVARLVNRDTREVKIRLVPESEREGATLGGLNQHALPVVTLRPETPVADKKDFNGTSKGSDAISFVGQSAEPSAAPPSSGQAPTRPNSSSLRFFAEHSDFVLNPRFTFEQFVTGDCNELAEASARAVASKPGYAYNPLFIHGASGLGKTHLLQAICHAALNRPEPVKILYLSCESFVNQFIQAVGSGEIEAFRYKHRKVDMLLIDDVQFLEGKHRTQEEFFHTFNTLHNAGKQIVLSSDRPPSSIATLQERLVSRFRWDMVTKVDRPGYETRVAIARRKANQRGIELPTEVAHCIAELIDTNIRELEGAVTRVAALAQRIGRPLDRAIVQESLRDLMPTRSQVNVQQIIELVSKEFGVPAKELQSRRRIQSILLPRQIGIFLARKHTQMSLEEIGGFFGGRDHSTILHSVRKVERLIAEDPKLAERIERLSKQLSDG